MSKRKLIIAVAFIGGAAVFLWTQHSINEKLRSDNNALRTAIAELRRLQKPGEPVAAAANESLTREQMDELLKLRGEVTRLRGQTDQIGALTACQPEAAGVV